MSTLKFLIIRFEQCQRMEAQRLQQFKEILFGVQKCLNISEDPVLPQIYEEFYHTVNNADHEKDLESWLTTLDSTILRALLLLFKSLRYNLMHNALKSVKKCKKNS